MARRIKINKDGSVHIEHDDIQHFDNGGIAGIQTPSNLNSPAAAIVGGPIAGAAALGSSPGQAAFQGAPGQVNSASNPNTGVFGSIGDALGLNNQFVGQGANITPGTNAGQLSTAYQGAQGALGQQQALASALTPGVTGATNAQNALLTAFQNQAMGKGPNPAQAQLNQNTGANIASTAALLAGMRGSSANPGLAAAQIAQQGAATQQGAVGQEAALQAQQELAAQQEEAGLTGQIVGQAGQAVGGLNTAQQSEQNILQNANTSYNNALVGMQENINNVNAATAAANQNMAGNLFGGLTSGLSSALGGGAISGMFGAKGGLVKRSMSPHMKSIAMIFHPKKYADGGEIDEGDDVSAVPSEPSSGPGGGPAVSLPADTNNFAKDMQSGSGGSSGGLGKGIASIAALAAAKGGMVPKYAAGGPLDFSASFVAPASSASSGPGGGSAVNLPQFQNAKWLQQDKDKKQKPASQQPQQPMTTTGQADPWEIGGGMAGGPMDATSNYGVSPDGDMAGNESIELAAKGGWMGMRKGGNVPGKPKVDHDSYSNDTVKAMLSPGEVVLPLHVMNSEDPASAAAEFVKAIVAKHGKSQGKEHQDFKVALKTAIKSRKK